MYFKYNKKLADLLVLLKGKSPGGNRGNYSHLNHINMAISRQIKCINKSDRYNPHERIISVGGDWGKISQPEAIRSIENGTYSYFVKVGIYDAKVIIATHNGNKYLKTDRDTTTVDNLLSLPECR